MILSVSVCLPPGVVHRPSGTKEFESRQRQAATSSDRTTDTFIQYCWLTWHRLSLNSSWSKPRLMLPANWLIYIFYIITITIWVQIWTISHKLHQDTWGVNWTVTLHHFIRNIVCECWRARHVEQWGCVMWSTFMAWICVQNNIWSSI